MRNAHLYSSLLLLLFSFASSTLVKPYFPAIPQFDGTIDNATDLSHHELFKRDGNCPSGYGSCAYMGQPSFCCKGTSNCAMDNVGHAACCPVGAVCTGTISGAFATAVSGQTATDSGGAAQATGGFSVVANPYYPFKAIPTTYANAAGCSAAYTGCQTDMAICTAYLQGQQTGVVTANGITIQAPNGGITVNGVSTLPAPTITMAPASASAICSSLSMQGCSGLQVAACSVYGIANGNGNGVGRGCVGGYGAAFGGVAVGLAGQMLLR